MLVSIIINNYNYGRYLRQCVDSALSQTYGDKEVIVVDDGSTDTSCEILDQYASRVTVIRTANQGQAAALNTGVRAAHGDVACFLDADDSWTDGKVAGVVAAIRRCAPSSWALLRHNLELSSGGEQGTPALLPGITGLTVERIHPEDVLVRRRNAPTSALCAPLAALRRIGPIPERHFRISADAYLYTHLPTVGEVISTPAVWGTYRVHGANAYYGRQKPEMLEVTARLELALLESLPDDTRYSDHLLAVFHAARHSYEEPLRRAGTLVQRLGRVLSRRPSAWCDPRTARTALREIARTLP